MGVRGGPYVTHQNQYLFLDLLLIALFKKVEVLYVVPGTLGSLSVPGEGLFFFFQVDRALYSENEELPKTKHSGANAQDACAMCWRKDTPSPHAPGS